MKYLLIFFACSFGTIGVMAQDVDTLTSWEYPEIYRKVSINMTPLITQLIPFNRTNPMLSGPYNVEFHRFRGNRAFHTSLGVFLNDGEGIFDSDDNIHLNFRMGSERRRAFGEKWNFYRGWDAYLSVGGYNLIGDNNDDSAILGIGPRWCIEYRISRPVSVSIETALVLGYDTNIGSVDFQFIPPVSVNLSFAMPRAYYLIGGDN